MNPRTSSLAASCCVGAMLALSACSGSSAPTQSASIVMQLPRVELEPGTVAPGTAALPKPAKAAPVITPAGSSQVLVGSLSQVGLSGKTQMTAPAGGSVLPLSWSTNASTTDTAGKKASLVVTVGSKSWTVADDLTHAGKALVGLSTDDASKVSVAVVFDGLAQYLDKSTSAPKRASNASAMYYDGYSSTGRGACPAVNAGADSSSGLSFSASCGLTKITRSPWLANRGWAKPGHQWLSIDAILVPGRMTFTNASKTTVNYSPVSYSITAAKAAGSGAVSISSRNATRTMIFSTPVSNALAVTMTQQYTAPATGTVPSDAALSQTVTLDATSNVVFDKTS